MTNKTTTKSLVGKVAKIYKKNYKTGETFFKFETKNEKTFFCSGRLDSEVDFKDFVLELKGEFYKTSNGSEVFKFKSASNCFKEEDSLITLFTSGFIGNISYKKALSIAKKLVNFEFNDFIFSLSDSYSRSFILDNVPELRPYENEIIKNTSLILRKREIFSLIMESGGSFSDAKKFSDKYPSEFNFKENGFTFLKNVGIPFSVADKIAQKKGVNHLSKERVAAVCMYALDLSEKNNDCFCEIKIPFNSNNNDEAGNFLYYCKEVMKEGCFEEIPLEFFIAEALNNRNIFVIEDEISKTVRVGKRKTYQKEFFLSKNILRLENSKKALYFNEENIEKIEKKINLSHSKEQLKAFECIKTSGVKVITGGPGTGKTTFINSLIMLYEMNREEERVKNASKAFSLEDSYEEEDLKPQLCSPTGRASSRLSESTGLKAETFHRWLDFKPFNEGVAKYGKQNQCGSDFYVFDEMSMSGLDISSMVFDSIKNGSTVILVGDIDQLQSVEKGNVFEDIIKSGLVEVYKLDSVFRQGEGSSVIKNSLKIKEGDTSFITDDSFEIITLENKEDFNLEIEKILKSKASYQFLSPTNKFFGGVKDINEMARETIFSNDEKKSISRPYLSYGDNIFYFNDKVIAIKNNYEKDYFNGEMGFITDIDESGIEVTFDDEKKIYVHGENLDEFLPAYAITIHKSQGSEFENVAITISNSSTRLLTRKILYTAVTRAKKKVKIIAIKGTLEKCLKSKNNEVRRKTFLREFLQNGF